MTEDELLKMAWKAYEEEMASRDTRDYEVNMVQFQKLIDAYSFFIKVASDCGGEVEPFRIEPTAVHGGLTAYFELLFLHGDEVEKLSQILSGVSAISIDTMVDGRVCISFTIPDVYKKKS